jgi:hypothetical protein
MPVWRDDINPDESALIIYAFYACAIQALISASETKRKS